MSLLESCQKPLRGTFFLRFGVISVPHRRFFAPFGGRRQWLQNVFSPKANIPRLQLKLGRPGGCTSHEPTPFQWSF